MGAPQEIVERCGPSEPEMFAVLPEAWETLSLFRALSTQWRFAGMDGQPTGLDYAAMPPAAAALGIELTVERFEDLRVMEAAAIAAWREKRK